MDMLYSVHLQWLLINIRAEQATARQKAEAEVAAPPLLLLIILFFCS